MMLIHRLFIVSLCGVVLSGLVLASPVPLPETALTQTADPVLVGAGDITNCNRTQDEATAQLLDGIAGTVVTLGDNAYPNGTLAQFNNCYGPTWGRHKSRTRPAPGNHDYHTAGASGYYTYFGATASPLETHCTGNCKGYYSYTLGDWHLIVLNSEIAHEAGSAQEQWLRADLAAHPSKCTLAYWHKPRFSSGRHGNNASVQPFWQALYEYGVDVVLNGHDHTYERFAPQNPTGQADPSQGIREFVVGTGGAGLYPFPTIQPNSEVRNNVTWGVLKLTLHATSYDWEFIPVAGQTFGDSGTGNCVGAGSAPTLPFKVYLPIIDKKMPGI
ncbi:MAG: metallophosphoesterase [Chloroflexota bacterium]